MRALSILVLTTCLVAFGEDAPAEVPAWLQMVMDFIVSIPGIGPVVLEVLKWIGVVAAAFTALATGVMAVAKALEAMGRSLGFVDFAQRVDALYKRVWPYIAWLSIYNAKKK